MKSIQKFKTSKNIRIYKMNNKINKKKKNR